MNFLIIIFIIFWEDLKIVDDALLKLYFKEIKSYPLLKHDQVIELLKKMKVGGQSGEAARQRLINSNVKLVIKIAKRYENLWPVLDLIQEGNIGLMMAVKRYDPSLGAKLSTYAVPWIKLYIFKTLKNRCLIRVPINTINRESKLPQVTSLTDLIHDDFEGSEYDIPSDDPSPFDCAYKNEKEVTINQCLKNLTKREKAVIKRRFYDSETLQQVGDDCGFTREYIRQVEASALTKLRRKQVLAELISG